MTTTTTSPIRSDELRARLRERLDAYAASDGDYEAGMKEAFGFVMYALTDAYLVVEDGNVEPAFSDEWLGKLETAMDAAAKRPFLDNVVPVIIDTMIELLPDAPAGWVATSDQLRSDLDSLR